MQAARLVGGHQLHRAGAENANAIERAAVADHLEETGVVVRRGGEPRSTGEALVRTVHVVPLSLGAFSRAHGLAVRSAGVDRGQPLGFVLRNVEASVLKAQRTGDASAYELVQRHARRLFHHAAEDVGIVAVNERFTRLRHERQRAKAFHRLANRLFFVGGVPAVAGGGAESFGGVHVRDVGVSTVGNASGMSQKVTDGDRPPGGDDLECPGVFFDGNTGFGERGDEVADGLVESDLAFLNQRHHSRAGDGLGLRGDAEQSIGGHLTTSLFVGPAEGAFVGGFAVAQNQRDRAGDLALVHVLL